MGTRTNRSLVLLLLVALLLAHSRCAIASGSEGDVWSEDSESKPGSPTLFEQEEDPYKVLYDVEEGEELDPDQWEYVYVIEHDVRHKTASHAVLYLEKQCGGALYKGVKEFERTIVPVNTDVRIEVLPPSEDMWYLAIYGFDGKELERMYLSMESKRYDMELLLQKYNLYGEGAELNPLDQMQAPFTTDI